MLFFSLVLAVSVLSGCEENNLEPDPIPEVENTAPTITGDTSVTFDIYSDAPDWASFVIVSDEEDELSGDDLVIDTSDVDFTVEGSYNVIYTVEDSEGLSASHTLSVTIVDNREDDFDLIGEYEITVEDEEEMLEIHFLIEGIEPTSIESDDVLAEIIYNESLQDIVMNEGLDSLQSYTVTYEDGSAELFVISLQDGIYEMYDTFDLCATAECAIAAHTGAGDFISSVIGPMSDADVVSNSYLIALDFGFTTIQDVLTHYNVDLTYGELYDVEWAGWSDVYIVLNIDDYYIGIIWL